jgi:hypothetical protein
MISMRMNDVHCTGEERNTFMDSPVVAVRALCINVRKQLEVKDTQSEGRSQT